jgi:murein DD-endopeptidase MepM/ murein hydrolase activator NlpD
MMKFSNYFLLIVAAVVFVSCKEEQKTPTIKDKPPKEHRYDFGFNLSLFNIVHDTVRAGDTFGEILNHQNIDGLGIHEISEKIKDTFDVRLIRKGRPYTLLRSLDRKKRLLAFIYQPDQLNYYVVDFRDSVAVSKKSRPVIFRKRTVAGSLEGSLSEALANQKVDPDLANKIAKIYQWSIDFFKLQKGAKFGVTFTERFINDTVYDGVDSLHASFFEYKGKKIYAFPFAPNPAANKLDYYDEEGKPLKNFFLKAPLKFSRISSRFSPRRFHPVQMMWKAHKGTDYAAPHGTPIMTTAAGIVEAAGYTAGNGNYVKVKHNNTYATQYLHMSQILVKRGQRVNQGDIIGKVGSTGLATGPHVCYRFWKNGEQVDPLRQNLPNAEPMSSELRPRFIQQMAPLKRELDSIAGLKFK